MYPVPTPETITRHCARAVWNDPNRRKEIAQDKRPLQNRIFSVMRERTRPGPLLDYGCSFGDFMAVAREVGWLPSGFEPNELASSIAAARGFDVRSMWRIHEAGFPDNHFVAITAVDSFYYTWYPYETLRELFRLLRPGGVLAMRLTNKRVVLGAVRALTRQGRQRDERISRILQGQFHSIVPDRLADILRGIGFERITIETGAMPAPWSTLPVSTRLAYGLSKCVQEVTHSKINLSPGILVFAQKDREGLARTVLSYPSTPRRKEESLAAWTAR